MYIGVRTAVHPSFALDLLDGARERRRHIPRQHPRIPQLAPHQFARSAVEVDAEGGGLEGLDALGDEAGDGGGGYVAGAAGGETGVGEGAEAGGAGGGGDEAVGAPQEGG